MLLSVVRVDLVARARSKVGSSSCPSVTNKTDLRPNRHVGALPLLHMRSHVSPQIRFMQFALLLAAFAMSAVVLSASAQVRLDDGKPQTGLPRITLSAGKQTIQADVAATEETRQKGLMYRKSMGKNEGMLFVFTQPGYYAMWMRNTPINLSVAYLDATGKIISIHEMEAFSEVPHQALGPVIYALEMNAKWFATNGVKVGDVIKGLEKAPKAR